MSADNPLNLLYCEKYGLLYLPIPKNASITIRKWLLQLNGVDADLSDPAAVSSVAQQWYVDKLAISHGRVGKEPFKFTFVRHPLSRLASVFLNKFVHSHHSSAPHGPSEQVIREIRGAGRLRRLSRQLFATPCTITFREFLTYLSHTPPSSWNHHWAPQWFKLSVIPLDYIGRVETFQADMEAMHDRLNQRRGVPKLTYRCLESGNVSGFNSRRAGRCCADVPSNELMTLTPLPRHADFFDESLENLACELFADDFRLLRYAQELTLSSELEPLDPAFIWSETQRVALTE